MEAADTDWLTALVRSAAAPLYGSVCIEAIDTVSLKGGYVTKAVDRIDITSVNRVGERSTASFIRKVCFAAEVHALKALTTVFGAAAVPEVIVSWSSAQHPAAPEKSAM